MNTHFRLSLLLILLAFNGVFAQASLPAVFEIRTDTADLYRLDGAHSQMLEDPQDNYTIEQVASPAFSNRFHANETAITGVNRKIHTYWLRFRIQNLLDHDVKICFYNPLYYQQLYTQDNLGNWQKQSTGELVPFSKRDGLKHAKKLPYLLKKGQEAFIYQQMQTYRTRLLEIPPPSFQVKEHFYEHFYTSTAEQGGIRTILINGMLIGIWLIAAVFNLIIFFLIRDRIYLYFSLWVFLYCCIHFYEYMQLLLYEEYNYPYWLIVPYLNWITAICQVQFIRTYLQTQRLVPKWDKALIIAISWYALGAILFQFIQELPVYILDKFDVLVSLGYRITCLIIGLTTIHMARKGDLSARFLLIITIPLMLNIGVLETIHSIYFFIIGNYLIPRDTYYTLRVINFTWMIVIFSIALIRRYNQARQQVAQKELEKEVEKSQLIEAQKAELERQVAERTAEVVAQNEEITQQKEEIAAQRDYVEQALEELKATQAQLIQKEKMASLGQLTAGIAHEIQNPLNFVNNFSEVSTELIEELQKELNSGEITEAKSIADDIKQNLEKIHHHGKRADSIVKGMLQHSRAKSGEKQLTDINALADEYLRLSYHGLRAKDKDFNVNLVTDFDPSIGKVEVVPQEIGRVLLNLFNNAFYATIQKKAQLNGQYQPEIQIMTKALGNTLEIRVRDNGTGVPESIKYKIFQPFFTTKPTGEGTGLGLSLSYDIITKGHGGEMYLETKEGEFTEFILKLSA